jgi:hypothetical protein
VWLLAAGRRFVPKGGLEEGEGQSRAERSGAARAEAEGRTDDELNGRWKLQQQLD